MDYEKIAREYPLLSKAEFDKYHALAGNPKSSERETLILSNLRLVISIAKRYANFYRRDLNDIIQDGLIGLNMGIEKYDSSRNIQPSTYLTWWIKQQIRRNHHNEHGIVRAPAHSWGKIKFYESFLTKFMEENGRRPNGEEIKAAGSDVYIGFLAIKSRWIVSLNNSSGESEKNTPLLNKIPFDGPGPLEILCEGEEGVGRIEEFRSDLKPREYYVLEQRALGKTLSEIADSIPKKMGQKICRERVRQISNTAIEKIKNSVRMRKASKMIEATQ